MDARDQTEPALDADQYHARGEAAHRAGLMAEAETLYRAALAMTPERAEIWSKLGLAVLAGGRVGDAFQCHRTALRLDPEDAEYHNNLGIAAHAAGALAEAGNHFAGALRLAPDHPHATLNLGVIAQSLGDLEQAEALYRRARLLGCDEARVNNNLALVLAERGRLADAVEACRDALALQDNYPEAEVNLGMILLMQGKLRQGWPHYEARWRIPPLSLQPRLPEATRWRTLDQAPGKTILLLAEQGFGDTLQFCRYAPMVQALGARVILAVPAPLARLMHTLAGVDQVIAEDAPTPAHDLHCHLLSLPALFRTSVETIPGHVPYLSADPDAAAAWSAILPARTNAAGPRVGLVWAGGGRPDQPQAAAVDRRRSMRLRDMAPLAEAADAVFVSLQLGPPARQIEDAPFPMIDLSARLHDFAGTAALIAALDLVIAVDTAVAHLAGALGKPVWLLSRFDACWRWMPNGDRPGPEDTPWYPTMRLFRQSRRGDWSDVMAWVAATLSDFRMIR